MRSASPVSVHLLPELIPLDALAGSLAVVIDVLRASTSITHALASGALEVRPCLEVEEARRLAASLPSGTALLAGERTGLVIEGFDLGNSPEAFSPEVCRDRTIVMTTTNGTRAIQACLDAEEVIVAAFANLSRVADYIETVGRGRSVHLVCSGTDRLVSWEDTLLAGALAHRLGVRPQSMSDPVGGVGFVAGNDSTLLALAASEDVPLDPTEDSTTTRLSRIVRGRGGQRVTEIGLSNDIEVASRIDSRPIVPRLERVPLRLVAASETI